MKKLLIVMFLFIIPLAGVSQEDRTEYLVRRGETIASIAKRYNISEQSLIENNPKLKEFCYVGMRLSIPLLSPQAEVLASSMPEQKKEKTLQALNNAKYYYDKGDYGKSVRYYKEAGNLGAFGYNFEYNYALCLYAKGDYDEAISELQSIFLGRPDARQKDAANNLIAEIRSKASRKEAIREERRERVLQAVGEIASGAIAGAANAMASGAAYAGSVSSPGYSGYNFGYTPDYSMMSSPMFGTGFGTGYGDPSYYGAVEAKIQMQQDNANIMSSLNSLNNQMMGQAQSFYNEWNNTSVDIYSLANEWQATTKDVIFYGTDALASFQRFFKEKRGRYMNDMETNSFLSYISAFAVPDSSSSNDESSSSSYTSTSSSTHREIVTEIECLLCHGTKKCHICNGDGRYFQMGLGSGWYDCSACNKTGRCPQCNGTGKQSTYRVE